MRIWRAIHPGRATKLTQVWRCRAGYGPVAALFQKTGSWGIYREAGPGARRGPDTRRPRPAQRRDLSGGCRGRVLSSVSAAMRVNVTMLAAKTAGCAASSP